MERGSFYQDENRRLCQVTELAVMKGSGEPLVVYQEMFGTYERKAEPLAAFQKRMVQAVFECQQKQEGNNPPEGAAAEENTGERTVGDDPARENPSGKEQLEGVSRRLLEFLEATTSERKLEILYDMKDEINDYVVDAMIVSLDFDIPEGLLEDRYQKLIRSLQTKIRYESARLR